MHPLYPADVLALYAVSVGFYSKMMAEKYSKATAFIRQLRSEVAYRTPSAVGDLEAGLGFATMPQVGYMNGLLRRCLVPEEWRLWVLSQLFERELETSKQLHWAEASALIELILDDEGEAADALGELMDFAMRSSFVAAQSRQNGQRRVIVVQQASFLD